MNDVMCFIIFLILCLFVIVVIFALICSFMYRTIAEYTNCHTNIRSYKELFEYKNMFLRFYTSDCCVLSKDTWKEVCYFRDLKLYMQIKIVLIIFIRIIKENRKERLNRRREVENFLKKEG